MLTNAHKEISIAALCGLSNLTQNWIRSSHGHSTPSVKISCKSVEIDQKQYPVPDTTGGGVTRQPLNADLVWLLQLWLIIMNCDISWHCLCISSCYVVSIRHHSCRISSQHHHYCCCCCWRGWRWWRHTGIIEYHVEARVYGRYWILLLQASTMCTLRAKNNPWAEERFYSNGGQGPIITQKYTSRPIQNIHYKPL